ncbi:hypothetical protein M3212_04800 [Alkalihalobacillus oceani]|uniref:hypothetical protein n=1 Tax=Halalkalibacter oceani TaxID=1653776 RepID=UPI00203C705F|nr:hypothetical protein [Halalkalibacter oceani]MCM3760107.1 hypothetical protein [Halalkalibacter oceani]
MSAYAEFIEEKKKIDELLAKGYEITNVNENLSGAFVEFQLPNDALQHPEKSKELHILTADARKYFSNLILAKQRKL